MNGRRSVPSDADVLALLDVERAAQPVARRLAETLTRTGASATVASIALADVLGSLIGIAARDDSEMQIVLLATFERLCARAEQAAADKAGARAPPN